MFEDIRVILSQRGDPYRWSALCDALSAARAQDPVHVDEVLLPEVRTALEGWDDESKVVPAAWTMRYLDADERDPLLTLPRVLRYRGREDYRLRSRDTIALSPLASHLRALDVYIDYHHNDHLGRFIDALSGAGLAFETLIVSAPGDAQMERWSEHPFLRSLSTLRIRGAWNLEPYLPKEARLRELESDSSSLPERDWLLGLRRLFVNGDSALAIARQIDGLEGLTTEADLDVLAEPRWRLRELRLVRGLIGDDIAALATMPTFAGLEHLKAMQTTTELARLLFDAKAAGRLPALQRATLGYMFSREEPYCEVSLDRPPSEAGLFNLQLGDMAIEAVDAHTLVWRSITITPYDLLDFSEPDEPTLSIENLRCILAQLAMHPPETLRIFSPTPEITEHLLRWPGLGSVRDLILVCDALQDDDSYKAFDALDEPYRADDTEIALLASNEGVLRIERLHLALRFNHDDRWRRKKLSKLPALPKLYTLDLSDNQLTDKDLDWLLASSLLQGVVRLSLARNQCKVAPLFHKDDGTFSRLEYLDLSGVSGYGTTGMMNMSGPLERANTFRKLETLLMRGSAKTEFGEYADAYMDRAELPNLSEVTTDFYYSEVFE